MLVKIKTIYGEYPSNFWVLIATAFIDRLGGALIFPFLALYITFKFSVGMTEVGKIFAVFAFASLCGNLLGGALTDKFGRKGMMIFGLVMSATSSLLMMFVNDLRLFYGIAFMVGLLADAGGPAGQAMLADILPEKQRAEGFGVLRVAINLAVTIGPAVGGLLASYSYLYLFIIDAITSLITAAIVFTRLPETRPAPTEAQPEQTLLQGLRGYFQVLKDRAYMAFIFVSALAVIVYMQMNTTLSVYLRDVHQIPPQGYGYILSLNAGMVVVLQFWISRRVSKRPPMLMMAFGTLFYAVGFAMYGFVASFALFLLAMVVITIGEMITSPTAQALAAGFAPESMRGRYLAVFGFAWLVPSAIGPLGAGLIMDNFDPRWVWYLCGLLASASTIGYLMLQGKARQRIPAAEVNPAAGALPTDLTSD